MPAQPAIAFFYDFSILCSSHNTDSFSFTFCLPSLSVTLFACMYRTVHAAAFVQRGGKRSDPQLGNIKVRGRDWAWSGNFWTYLTSWRHFQSLLRASFLYRYSSSSAPLLSFATKSGVFEIHAPNKFKAARQLDQDFDKLRKTSDDVRHGGGRALWRAAPVPALL